MFRIKVDGYFFSFETLSCPSRHNLSITEGSRGVKEGNLSHLSTSALSEVLSEKVTVTDRAAFGSESMPLSAA